MDTVTERIARAGSRLRHPAGRALPPSVQRTYLAGVAAELHAAAAQLTETCPTAGAARPPAAAQRHPGQPPTPTPDSPTGAE